MEHHFNVEIATKYGILEAVLLNNFYFWIKKNEANETGFHDGYYWTYNSTKALHKLFPYASEHKIRNALKRLEDEGLLITGNYNKSAYDRTMWYALTKNAISILQNYKMEVKEKQNGICEIDTPIPYNKTDNNTDIKSIIDYLNQKAGTHYRASTESTRKAIRARLAEKFTIDDFKTVIDKKVKQWKGTKMEEYLRPQTLFGSKFESYLNQHIVEEEKKPQERSGRLKEYRSERKQNTVSMPDEMRNKVNQLKKGVQA